MGLLGTKKERCLQLYFRDDHSFIFRTLPIENTFVLEKQGEKTKAAWMMPYKVLKKFYGFNTIKAAMLLVSFSRDIILDTFNQMQDSEKPERGKGLVKTMISEIATGVFYKHETGKKMSTMEKMVVFVGGTMMILAIAITIVAAT